MDSHPSSGTVPAESTAPTVSLQQHELVPGNESQVSGLVLI